ncbi:hypothetical protein WR25_18395 [Diploscapter pachys]|uniref:Uncharacterized protein n=1 Tax=Diploscapter pachys TaxID=2018661 RepID=A0A2A2JZB2_9BILA|nr:hypothetical protein WR25_18395 [Diploscapter pachys]
MGSPSFEAAGDKGDGGDRVWSGETTTGTTGRRIISSGVEPAGGGCAERRICALIGMSPFMSPKVTSSRAFVFPFKANLLQIRCFKIHKLQLELIKVPFSVDCTRVGREIRVVNRRGTQVDGVDGEGDVDIGAGRLDSDRVEQKLAVDVRQNFA